MKSKNDILISKHSIKYYFKYLEWDTNFFNKTSYVLDLNQSILLEVDKSLIEEINIKLKDSFVTVKLPVNVNPETLFFLQECGFYYINTEVVLKYNFTNLVNNNNSDILIERLENNFNLPYEKLGGVFSKTRFHDDVHIENKLADLLWVNYIKNFVPSDTHFIFVAKYNSNIVGAILVNLNNNIANLFFVGVVKEFQGSNIGKQLIQKVISYFSNYELTVGTQSTNISALNFYMKSGFSLISTTSTVLHRWS